MHDMYQQGCQVEEFYINGIRVTLNLDCCASLQYRWQQLIIYQICQKLFPFLGQATWSKMTSKLLHLWRHSQKICNPQPNIFFRVPSTRLADPFEPLNSSLAQSAEELGRW